MLRPRPSSAQRCIERQRAAQGGRAYNTGHRTRRRGYTERSTGMASQPPILDERVKDEGGLATVVRFLLQVFAFFLLIPPWGIIVWFYSVKIVSEYAHGSIFRRG